MHPFRTLTEMPEVERIPNGDSPDSERSPSERFAERLASFDRAEVDRVFAHIATDISEAFSDEYYVDRCQGEIVEILRSGVFTDQIQSAADLDHCLEGIMGLVRGHLQKTETGVDGGFCAMSGLKKDVSNVLRLVRGDFHRDFGAPISVAVFNLHAHRLSYGAK